MKPFLTILVCALVAVEGANPFRAFSNRFTHPRHAHHHHSHQHMDSPIVAGSSYLPQRTDGAGGPLSYLETEQISLGSGSGSSFETGPSDNIEIQPENSQQLYQNEIPSDTSGYSEKDPIRHSINTGGGVDIEGYSPGLPQGYESSPGSSENFQGPQDYNSSPQFFSSHGKPSRGRRLPPSMSSSYSPSNLSPSYYPIPHRYPSNPYSSLPMRLRKGIIGLFSTPQMSVLAAPYRPNSGSGHSVPLVSANSLKPYYPPQQKDAGALSSFKLKGGPYFTKKAQQEVAQHPKKIQQSPSPTPGVAPQSQYLIPQNLTILPSGVHSFSLGAPIVRENFFPSPEYLKQMEKEAEKTMFESYLAHLQKGGDPTSGMHPDARGLGYDAGNLQNENYKTIQDVGSVENLQEQQVSTIPVAQKQEELKNSFVPTNPMQVQFNSPRGQ